MNKFIYAFIFLLLTTTASVAQQHRYALKIGLHAGLSNYYGDLSYQAWDLPHQFKQPIQDFNFLSYGVSVEYHISRTFGLRLWGMKSQFKASDRSYESSGAYNRALNVQTDLFDASLLGIVYFDNDLVLRSRAVLAPYFMFGGGLTHFETKGDLLSADNNRYYYWSDNSIRTESESGLNAANAQVIEQDHKYETSLSPLNTEGANYSPITWNVALGLGLKFRLSSRFHLHLEALVRYTGTDYLDDVSGAYRSSYNDNFQAYAANPSNVNRSTRGASPEMNDWYTFVGLSAHYSFGQKTYNIQPSIIYTENLLLLLSSNNNTTTPVNSNNNTPVPTNTTGSDTTIQKVIKTTTTIKTVTVDTFNNSSSSAVPNTTTANPSKVTPVVPNKVTKPRVRNLLGDSISQVRPPMIPGDYKLDSSRLSVDSLAQNELPQRGVDSLLNDSVTTLVSTPKSTLDSTRLPIDAVVTNSISKPAVNTIFNNSVPKVAAPNSNIGYRDSISIQNRIITATNPADIEIIRGLELQEQKYQYELLLQKERYERQLAELKLQKDLEQERKKSAPNTKEQDLQYQLKLEQQKLVNELEKQRLLNQLEVEKNRPAPDTKQEELKLQQQKYEADLKLQQQEYEYKLKIQELQNQLNIEQLKKAKEGTGAVNTPAPSNATAQELERLNSPVKEENAPIAAGRDTIIISNNIQQNANTATKEDLIRMQANQQALLLKISNLERLANANNGQNNKPVNSIIDTVYIKDNNANNNETYTPSSSETRQADLIRMQIDQQELLLKIRNLEAAAQNSTPTIPAARDTIRIVQRDSIFVGNSDNSELTKQLNQQRNSNNSLVEKLAIAKQKSTQQQRKIDSLQTAISKVESEKKTVSNELDAFLTQKKGTYVTKIYFDVGKSNLTVQAKETLTTLVYYLEKYPGVQFWVKGFASKTGRTETNQRLSAERAGEVAGFLKQAGIQSERIRSTPLGELDSSARDELDRRAEVHLSF
jgi:outer membrane protein OmpA-like peptidoglycan-associated protein